MTHFYLTEQAKMEQEALLATLQRERDSYLERLLAAKETMAAQEQEIQAKESRYCTIIAATQLYTTDHLQHHYILQNE